MFHILGKNPPQAARLGLSNATNFGTCGKRIDSTNEYIEVALILGNIRTAVRIGIGGLEALQLGVDGNKAVVTEKAPSVASKGARLQPQRSSC